MLGGWSGCFARDYNLSGMLHCRRYKRSRTVISGEMADLMTRLVPKPRLQLV